VVTGFLLKSKLNTRDGPIIGSATRYRPIFGYSAIGPVSDADAEYTGGPISTRFSMSCSLQWSEEALKVSKRWPQLLNFGEFLNSNALCKIRR